MKKYVKLDTSLRERLMFLFTGIIAEDSVTIVTPGKREPGKAYTHYPIFPDPQEPPPPTPEYKPCTPDKSVPPKAPKKSKARPVKTPQPPKPPPIRVVNENIFKVSKEEKMPDIPFFELDQEQVKSNL